MTRALLIFVSCAALAQTPQFEVTDVHETLPGTSPSRLSMPTQFDFRGATVAELIQFAFTAADDMITGGPAWIGSKKFDVVAKSAKPANLQTTREMMRSLLADRFKLTYHTEPKPMPVFILSAGKKILMKQTMGENQDCQGAPGEDNKIKVTCKNMSMDALAQELHQMAGGYITHPMINATGVEGRFDFTLTWTGRGALGVAPNSTSVFEAVEKQLGLKIEEGKRPLPVIVIDSIAEAPTPNAEGAADKLAIKETEFEVAEIKPSRPDAQMMGRFQPNGRLDVQAMPLRQLLSMAYKVDSDDLIVGPKWMADAKFDIVAKTNTAPPFDVMRVMLKSLLIERFEIKTHVEDQPVSAYALVVKKGAFKLEKADPADRQQCKKGAEKDLGTWTCKNTTMAQLAEDLPRIANGYVVHPAFDSTGLEGGYNFVLSWTPRQVLDKARGGESAHAAGGVALPADPSGVSLFEALERLGLKLDLTKKPMPVTVIDHINQAPTAN